MEWEKAVQVRPGKGKERTFAGGCCSASGRGVLSPSCRPSSFACEAVLLVVPCSSLHRGTLLSSPQALRSANTCC